MGREGLISSVTNVLPATWSYNDDVISTPYINLTFIGVSYLSQYPNLVNLVSQSTSSYINERELNWCLLTTLFSYFGYMTFV